MNPNIVKVATDEAAEILSNARAARLDGEIDQRKFDEINQSCFDACCRALGEQLRSPVQDDEEVR